MDEALSEALDQELIESIVELAEAAGAAIMKVYETDFRVETKADTSPLTQADLAAHGVIEAGLKGLTPDIPLFSEESDPPPFEVRRGWQRYWLVDPLDGTKEFVNRNGEFTVNIALIEDHVPVFGVVHVPVREQTYVGVAGTGAYRLSSGADGAERTPLTGRAFVGGGGGAAGEGQPLVVVASRSHGGERLENYLDALKTEYGSVSRTPVGSSLKLCILAEGEADLYPRLGPTSEWDIAAAHAVLAAAGGDVWAVDGTPLTYNKGDSVLNPEFFAVADGSADWRERLPPVPAAE